MKIEIKFKAEFGEYTSHLRRKIVQFMNLLELTPTINSPSDCEWTELKINAPAPLETTVDRSLPTRHQNNPGKFERKTE